MENKNTEPKKDNRGGARKGAGRKKIADKRKNFLIMLNDAERAKLDEMRGALGASKFIRRALGLSNE